MRTIGFFIITLLLWPCMTGPLIQGDQQLSATAIKIPATFPPIITSPGSSVAQTKTNNIDTSYLKQTAWYADVMKGIEESEYEIQASGKEKFASPNRKQNLRATYTADKFILTPRSGNDWTLQLQVEGIYSEKKKIFSPQAAAIATTEKNKIRFDHDNNFIVEYINSKEGVRQNFIIEKEPASATKEVSIKLQTNKGWYIDRVHPKEVHFARAKGDGLDNKIVYNDLKVWDATHHELDASFSVFGNEISINVNTVNAVYPVTIDPLSSSPSSILDDCDQANANFGVSVASAGDVNGDGYSDVIIGAYSFDDGFADEGKAFVYHGSATGLSSTPNNTPDDADQASAQFGVSVACAGDVNGDGYSDVIIGAWTYTDGGNTSEGRAFVYYGSSTGLAASPGSTPDDADQAFAQFGYSVACAGDVNGDGYSDVIIGAYTYDDGPNTDEGRAFLYYGSSTGLASSPVSTPDDADQGGAQFGVSVACAGDVNGDGYSDVIIGAYTYDDGVNTDEGRAFLYYGSSTGLASTPGSTPDDANQSSTYFGFSVAAAGDVNGDGYSDVIIGAATYDDGANTDEGRAFVYYGSSTGLLNSPTDIPDDADQGSAFFGISVAPAGDINGDGYADVIVGAHGYDDGANTDEGRAFIYLGSSTGLSSTPSGTPGDANQSFAQFGRSVAPAGDVNGDGYSDVIIGANGYNDGANTDEGWAFVYHGGPDGLNASAAAWTAESNQASAEMGFHVSGVASAGDVNADGYSDVIIGIPYYDNGQTDEGVVWVYYGSSTGLPLAPNWTAESDQANAYFGVCVSYAGDVNGDGYGDVIISASYYDNGQTDEGRAYVYHGSASGLGASPAWTAESDQANATFGFCVAGLGDVNGDGYGDVIVSAWRYDHSFTDEGAAFVYYGSSTGLATSPAWTVYGNQLNALLGHSVASAGDVNGDGFSDVIVGVYYYDNGQTDEGVAWLFNGSATGLPASPNWTGECNVASAGYGVRVASAGDVNGDGYGDVIIGAHTYTNGQANEGAAFVYYGSSTGLPASANWSVESNNAGALFGICSSAGDVNGDGYSDVLIGGIFFTNGESSEGKAFVYHGSSSGLPASANWTYESNQVGANLSYSVACAGDVNGDGFSDILVGSPWYDNGQTDEGKVFLFYGNKNGGLRNNLSLYNSDLTTPIQQSNFTDPNLFGIGLYARSFLGRQKGKLVWETEWNGQPFSGNPITNSVNSTGSQTSYTNLGTSGTELKNQVAKRVGHRATYVRARIKYDPVTAITGQLYGPWKYPEGFLRGKRDIGSVALPVKFISFTAVKDGSTARLKWITTEEEPGVKFEVQHSIDGINFITVAMINGSNQSNNEYEWLHTDPVKGNNFYRIRAVEQTKTALTDIKKLHFGNDEISGVYPNPTAGGQVMTIKNTNIRQGEHVIISLISPAGQNVFQENITATNNGKIALDVPFVAPGTYILIVKGESAQFRQKIIVSRQ